MCPGPALTHTHTHTYTASCSGGFVVRMVKDFVVVFSEALFYTPVGSCCEITPRSPVTLHNHPCRKGEGERQWMETFYCTSYHSITYLLLAFLRVVDGGRVCFTFASHCAHDARQCRPAHAVALRSRESVLRRRTSTHNNKQLNHSIRASSHVEQSNLE